MKNNLSNCLGILPENVNIKSTTTDGLGFLGNSEGIATLAIATMENII
jgi:2-C-methyl-D-erythritol 2,4-cyclodiphosphate synthase